MGLPRIPGRPISICVKPQLTTYRGQLLSGDPLRGVAVHAASFIRDRRIVLEEELFAKPALLRLILVHELFHFVWPSLRNELRLSYERLLEVELEAGARLEIGESAGVRKELFAAGYRCWKEYVCESFCDTAAWLYSGIAQHATFRLGKTWRKSRVHWFRDQFERYWELRCS